MGVILSQDDIIKSPLHKNTAPKLKKKKKKRQSDEKQEPITMHIVLYDCASENCSGNESC